MTRMAPVRYTRRRQARRTSGALLAALGACALVAALALVLGALAPIAAPAASGGSGEPATSDARGDWRLGSVPRLYQTDPAWADEPYAGGTVRENGCGPTCLSMVSLALTGWQDNDPYSVAQYAQENGYYVSGSGSSWSLMSEGCAHFGLESRELSLDENEAIRALEQGELVICAMGPGDFTDNGHYIILAGYSDGAFVIRDPNSPQNSMRTWTFQEIQDQIKNLWSFSAATGD